MAEKGGASTFLVAAQAVLAQANEPLHWREITERGIAAGFIQTSGKTPEATMAAQLYTHIKRRGDSSTFVQVGKSRFGLREWGASPGVTTPRPPDSPKPAPAARTARVTVARDAAERIVAEIEAAQRESYDAVRFELALTEAFAYLGFDARHVGGPGQTDVILNARVTGTPYRVIVDAKSNKNGKVADGNIDWLSLDGHRKDTGADHILIVAPGFGGGNLLRRADEYRVALLTGDELIEVVGLHRGTPFSLLELRPLFQAPGRVTEALDQLRQTARGASGRWALLRTLITLIEGFPSDAYPDAGNLWLLLNYTQKESGPTLDEVTDAVTVLASRVVGILKANGDGGYALTMSAETAYRRLHALVRIITSEQGASGADLAAANSTAASPN